MFYLRDVCIAFVFIALIGKILIANPEKRITIAGIKEDEWFKVYDLPYCELILSPK